MPSNGARSTVASRSRCALSREASSPAIVASASAFCASITARFACGGRDARLGLAHAAAAEACAACAASSRCALATSLRASRW